MMRFTTYLFSLLLALLLASCGGGGGSPGLVQGIPLSTSAGAENFLPVGGSYQFKIYGGVSPYRVQNGNFGVARAWVDGDFLTIGVVGGGTSEMLIVDFRGNSVPVKVTGGSSIDLYTTAPADLTIPPGAPSAQTFRIGGGATPYSITSSSPGLVSVSLSGSFFTLTGLAVTSAPVPVVIKDSASKTVTINVSVGTVPLTLTPGTATAATGDVINSIIRGGVPPYSVSVPDPSFLSASIANGNELTVTLNQKVGTAVATVRDSIGQTATFTATITLPANNLRLTPNALTVSESDSASITLNVVGAAAGTINVFSSSSARLSASISGTTITVSTGASGRCVDADTDVIISAVDSKGFVGTATIKIKDNNGAAGCLP